MKVKPASFTTALGHCLASEGPEVASLTGEGTQGDNFTGEAQTAWLVKPPLA